MIRDADEVHVASFVNLNGQEKFGVPHRSFHNIACKCLLLNDDVDRISNTMDKCVYGTVSSKINRYLRSLSL